LLQSGEQKESIKIAMVKIYICLVIGIISISLAAIFAKFCYDVPSTMIATYRMGISAILLFVIFPFSKTKAISLLNKKNIFMCFLSGIFLSMHFIFWFISIKLTNIASSVVLVTTSPIFLGIISKFILKKQIPRKITAGILLSFVGTLLIAQSDSNILNQINVNILLGDFMALLGSLMASLYLLIGGIQRTRQTTFEYIFLTYSFSAIILILLSVFLDIPFTGFEKEAYLFLILLAIIPQLLGHTIFNYSLKHLSPESVAITILGEPVGASILAYFIFDEKLQALQVIGIILILYSIILATKMELNH
jgi:drug/metabolite transporter (DMT)-like permease